MLALAATTAAAQDAPDPVTTALADGEVALAHHDARGLMRAAKALAEHHARPEPAAPDLARTWAHQAVQWGAHPVTLRPWRGRLSGPGYRLLVLPAGGRFSTRQVFTAGQPARVDVAALGPGPFRLSVDSADSNPLCQRSASAGHLTCAWVPPFSEPHEIVVENTRNEPARYYLVTF